MPDGFLRSIESASQQADKPALAPSDMLRREVHKKENGGKLMVQKFLLRKTNKEQSGESPAYVFSHVNFRSEGASGPLRAEARISDSSRSLSVHHYRAVRVSAFPQDRA
ncbi:MAG: hypothetical protein LBV01_02610 [Deltaproteobacteria bacterium]|nr:hypothetical protein [Deltaproteobacteria bacterium]